MTFRSGFVTLAGRPNVGKSTLVNTICGEKVSIVSDKPQTTRVAVRAILHRPDAQLVFVDTPLTLVKPALSAAEAVCLPTTNSGSSCSRWTPACAPSPRSALALVAMTAP